MVLESVLCPVCHQPEAVYRHGQATDGIQRYRCTACRRTFQVRYLHKIHELGVQTRITDIALNGSGIRDTAHVLGISTQAVMAGLKKIDVVSVPAPTAGVHGGPGPELALVRRRDVVVRGPQQAAALAHRRVVGLCQQTQPSPPHRRQSRLAKLGT